MREKVISRSIVDFLDGQKEGQEWRCRCPVHGGRSLCVTERDGRILLICRAGCPQREVISELKRLGLWGGATSYEAPLPEPEPANDSERNADRVSDLWNESLPITSGDPVHSYLKNRGIVLPEYPEDLRTHPALPYWMQNDNGKPILLGKWPAMLAVVRNPQGRPVALHRTYITSDGRKAPVQSPKKLFKVFDLSGGTVRPFPLRDGFLAVCEGIEDALSAWILWQIPCWATIGTSGLKGFIPPEDVKKILVLANNDGNGAGQRAAWELQDKMEETGRVVRVLVPEDGSKDLNAYLLARQEANMRESAG